MRAYYINLSFCKERKERITKQLDHFNLDYTRIPAIYGKDLSEFEKRSVTSRNGNLITTEGMVGCFLSHKKAWTSFIKDGGEYALILEDDSVLTQKFDKKLRVLLKELETYDWDFVYLSYLTLGPLRFFKNLTNSCPPKAKTFFVPKQPLGFNCYLIKRGCALRLLHLMKEISYHIDVQFLYNASHFKVFASKKMLAKQYSTSSNSTISNSKFPYYINTLIDNSNLKHDDISYSYFLGAPIVRIPGTNTTINAYVLLMFWLCFVTKKAYPYILSYMIIEFFKTKNVEEKYFIVFWVYLLSFTQFKE